MKRRVIYLLICGVCLLGVPEGLAREVYSLNVGAFGNCSLPLNGFSTGESSGFAGGAKVGLGAGRGGLDFSWSLSRFEVPGSGRTAGVEHHDLSLYFTHRSISQVSMDSLRTVPFLSVGSGFYRLLDSHERRLGGNIGAKVLHYLHTPKASAKASGFPVQIDVTALYHAFPSESQWMGFFELRAGLNVFFLR